MQPIINALNDPQLIPYVNQWTAAIYQLSVYHPDQPPFALASTLRNFWNPAQSIQQALSQIGTQHADGYYSRQQRGFY